MWACYELVHNFGWAIIIFTVIVKAAMLPLNIKQQKNTAISQLYAPRVREIQQKYKNNQQKQQEELTKLQKEGYNPTGGCGTVIITFLILFGVIDVVYKPMTHMIHFDSASISSVVSTAKSIDVAEAIIASPEDYKLVLEFLKDESVIALVDSETTDENGKTVKTNNRIVLSDDFNYEEAKAAVTVTAEDLESLKELSDDKIRVLVGNTRLSDKVRNTLNPLVNSYYAEASLYKELRALNCYSRQDAQGNFKYKDLFVSRLSTLSSDSLKKFDELSENMFFFGINLGEQPTLAFNTLLIIPILSFIFSAVQIIITQYYSKKQNPELMAGQQQGCMNVMFVTMPLFSLYISFTVPAGAGFYWGISYLIGIAQAVLTNKFWPADKIRAEAKAKMEAQAAAKEQRVITVQVDEDGNKTEKIDRISQLTQKEIRELNKKKLEAARRADAEKYGEVYVESDDDEDY